MPEESRADAGRPMERAEHDATPLIEPIPKAVSLATQAYEHIKAAIIAGDLIPGQLYSVSQFAALLGVSRTPVREALLALAAEGLLTMDRNRGFRVLPMSAHDVEEITQLRQMLEIPAIAQVARLQPPPREALRRAREIYADLQKAADEGNLLEFLALDRQFHLTLIDALGNKRLTRLVGELRDHMHLPGLRRLAISGQLHESGRDHLVLLEALEAGDADAAVACMERHLGRIRTDWA